MLKTMPCEKCGGTGRQQDPRAIGQEFRRKRIARGVSLRSFAKQMHLSAMYISDLERGRRNWDEWLINRYEIELNHTTKPKSSRRIFRGAD